MAKGLTGRRYTYPMPVFGTSNDKPFGPCHDTDVNFDLVERGMITFLGDEIRDSKEPGPERVERAVS
jgi:hypothetical protein